MKIEGSSTALGFRRRKTKYLKSIDLKKVHGGRKFANIKGGRYNSRWTISKLQFRKPAV